MMLIYERATNAAYRKAQGPRELACAFFLLCRGHWGHTSVFGNEWGFATVRGGL